MSHCTSPPHKNNATITRAMFHCTIHTHCLTALFPGLPGWAGTRKVKPNLDFTEARDSEWQWHQLGHMQVCISLLTDNHASTTPLQSFFTGRMPFLPPNQQRQSTEGNNCTIPGHKNITTITHAMSHCTSSPHKNIATITHAMSHCICCIYTTPPYWAHPIICITW